jgi:hypothetical protein
MARYVFIVSRDRPGLSDYMASHFADEAEVAVILDRRVGERRRAGVPVATERRAVERRVRASVQAQIHAQDFALVVVS